MKTLETKYEEEKRSHNERTKKQNEELEDLTTILNEVKLSLHERIAKYGEEEDKKEISELNSFDIVDNSGNGKKNDEKYSQRLRYSSDNIEFDAFSSCSTLALDKVETKESEDEYFYPD